MIDGDSLGRVRVVEAASGARTYLVDVPPEALPPVRPRDLHAAWENARGAALAERWGRPLLLRFRRPEGESTELALADADACCWAAAVDTTVGLRSAYGLSLFLRLLALVELLPRAAWAMPLVALRRDGAAIHPGLMQAASRVALTPEARFDAATLRAATCIAEATPAIAAPSPPVCASGARA